MNATYDLDYTLRMIRQAVDFAEIEGDFRPLRKWLYEAEQALQADTLRRKPNSSARSGSDNSWRGQLAEAGFGEGGAF